MFGVEGERDVIKLSLQILSHSYINHAIKQLAERQIMEIERSGIRIYERPLEVISEVY